MCKTQNDAESELTSDLKQSIRFLHLCVQL